MFTFKWFIVNWFTQKDENGETYLKNNGQR